MDNIGITASWTNGNKTDSLGVRANISELKVGVEGATAIQWDNTIQTDYINISGSAYGIAAVYVFATSGQNILKEAPSY